MTLPEGIELDRRLIPGQLADGLTHLVLSGELAPGQPLHEREIAADLADRPKAAVLLACHIGSERDEALRALSSRR